MRRQFTLLSLLLSTLAILSLACSKSSKTDSSTKSPNGTNPEKTNNDGGNGKNDGVQNKPPFEPCEAVSKEELKSITGVDFQNANGTGNVKALSSCDYRTTDGQKSVGVSIIRANAKSRMESAKKFPQARSIPSDDYEIVWSPVNGLLDIRKGNDVVAILLSRSLGSEEDRIKFGKKIAELVFKKL